MEVDRWVVPPAVAAAAFSLAAVSPPVTTADLARGLRVEAATAADGVVLVRASMERTSDGELTAPRALTVEHAGASLTARATGGVPSVSLAVPTAARAGGRARLVILAEELRASVTLPVRAPDPAPPPAADAPLAAAVAEGNLLPDVEGTVLVRAPGAAEARVEPQLEGAAVSPARAEAGPCGVVTFRVRVEGMGAPVTLVARRADGVEARAHVRLPLRPGGVSLARENGAVIVRGAFAGQAVYVAAGGPAGVRWWSTVRLERDEECPRAAVALPAGVTWVRASTDALFRGGDAPALRWDVAPPQPCQGDGAARRWAEATVPVPPGPAVGLAFDGAARARAAIAARVRRARALAWAGLAGSIAAEVALMLGLGLRQGMSDVEGARGLRRDDLGRFATGVIALMLLGFALALASSRAVP